MTGPLLPTQEGLVAEARRHISRNRGWLLLSGVVAIGVGALVAFDLPNSSIWTIGLLAGVNLIATGFGFILVALADRRSRQTGLAVG